MTDERVSRRAVLGGTTAVLAGLAGCSGVSDLVSEDERRYDASAIAAAISQAPPDEPETLPVSVSDAMLARHRSRARDLLDDVPADPGLPNEALANELAEKRKEVASRLGEDHDSEEEPRTRRERLGELRRDRAEAARVAGAYRAATGDIDPQAIVDRSERIRADLLDFRRDWRYETATPPGGVVLHAELEERVEDARFELQDWPPLPADFADNVFRVGRAVGSLEDATASVGDATRFRERYVSGRDTTPYRYDLAGALERLDYHLFRSVNGLHDYLDEDSSFPPGGDRTPAAAAWREARDVVREEGDGRRGHQLAGGFLGLGRTLAGRHGAADLVSRIRADEVTPPEDADAVAARYEAARSALADAWRTSPPELAVAFAEPATELVWRAYDELRQDAQRAGEVNDAVGWLHYAELHAKAVPDAVEVAVAALPDV